MLCYIYYNVKQHRELCSPKQIINYFLINIKVQHGSADTVVRAINVKCRKRRFRGLLAPKSLGRFSKNAKNGYVGDLTQNWSH